MALLQDRLAPVRSFSLAGPTWMASRRYRPRVGACGPGFLVAARALTQHASFAAFDQLGVKNGHAGQDLAQGNDPPTLAAEQGLIEGGPAPLSLPASQIVVADSTGRKLVGK